jgi:cytochrome c biogenesis protein CcdA
MIPILLTAFTAGLVATVNPCGFAMLPAYLGFFLGIDDTQDRKTITAVGHALRTGAVVSSGFLLVFGIAGAIIVAGVRSLTTVLPWVALVVGIGLVGLGIALLRGRYLTIRLPSIRGRKERTNGSLFVFGISYAIASLSCTLPIFLSLVATTFTQTTFLAGFAAFVAYGLGMSMVLIGITVALALGKDTLVRKLRSTAPYINKISGVVMIAAGGFIVWYWATILRSGASALSDNVLVRFVDRLSATLTTAISGNPLTAAAVALAVIAVPIAVVRSRHRSQDVEVGDRKVGRS